MTPTKVGGHSLKSITILAQRTHFIKNQTSPLPLKGGNGEYPPFENKPPRIFSGKIYPLGIYFVLINTLTQYDLNKKLSRLKQVFFFDILPTTFSGREE
jgi:hypothetical protein